MTETSENNTVLINNVCRVCLNTSKHLITMEEQLTKLYRSFIDKILYKEHAMKICVICEWMLRRFVRFRAQCQSANHMLNEAICMDSKSLQLNFNLVSSHYMTKTSPIIIEYIPFCDNTIYDDTHFSIHTHSTFRNSTDTSYCDVTSVYPKSEEAYSNDDQCYVDDFGGNEYAVENDKYKAENDKYMNENDTHDNYEDEDEVPLLLISNMSKRKTRRKSKMKRKLVIEEMDRTNKLDIEDEPATKEDNQTESNDRLEKSKRSKKVIKDGFSSRMVQETSEYIVIKLTKEQVLQEMEERSKTDAYISSPYKCDKCVKGFNFQDVLLAHMEKHSLKNGTFACEMCGQYCPSAVSLRGHIKSHTTRYECKVCGAVRASRQHLVEHHAAHSGAAPHYQCLQCTFTTSKRTVMQRHARGHATREPHACDKCGKLFKNIHYLRLHAARHDKSSRHKCPQCPASFLYQSLVRAHVRSAHERGDLYCVECDLRFKCAESLRVHFKKAKRHRDASALNYPCPKCPASFASARTLATHRATHATHATHACAHCRSTYSTRAALRAHAWRVHSRAACPHCRAAFASKSLLSAHLSAAGGACAASHDRSTQEDLPQYDNKIEV